MGETEPKTPEIEKFSGAAEQFVPFMAQIVTERVLLVIQVCHSYNLAPPINDRYGDKTRIVFHMAQDGSLS
ncbi:hypothetical protein AX774_g2948, partial [Zancudomyces culisetae]